MTNQIYDLLMIDSFDLNRLIEDYRLFFLSLIPGSFVLACIIEYFDRMNVFELVRRALISILILTSVSSFYKTSIDLSIDAANEKFNQQKHSNILLMDMFTAGKHLDDLGKNERKEAFEKAGTFNGAIKFIKYHFFSSFINDSFTISVYFISQLCFVLLKVVYSLVYYLGYGLIGIPCIIYLFPSMGNVLRGGVLSFLWCLIVPHVLVFILSMIGSEINTGYQAGQVIGGSASGTALLFILTVFIAFTPFITMMLINGSGIAQAGGIIALAGGHFIRTLPGNTVNTAASVLTGRSLGPKMQVVKGTTTFGVKAGAKGISSLKRSFGNTGGSTKASEGKSNISSNSVKQSNSNDRGNKVEKSDRSLSRPNQTNYSKPRTNEVSNVQNQTTGKTTTKVDQYRARHNGNKKTNTVNSNTRNDRKHIDTKRTSVGSKQRGGKKKV